VWPQFAERLKEITGVDTEYRKPGGLVFCLGETEFEARRQRVQRLRAQADVFDTEMLERQALQALIPAFRLGDEVTGASYCPHDGHANPLMLLRALHAALRLSGAHYRPDAPARAVQYRDRRFVIDTPHGPIEASRVVLAAGHGTPALAAPLGLHAPIRAERGQIIVTERVRPVLPMPGSGIRQTEDGTIMIGTSKEDVGFDLQTTVEAGANMASRALRVAPDLARVRIQRTWAGLRVLTPDIHPLYAQSEQCPGAFVALCHSGVTLASVHAMDFADAVLAGRLPESMNDFHPRRFDVPKAA
jgi:glycine/D-amino acid oxidase-like deaminating enzyme